MIHRAFRACRHAGHVEILDRDHRVGFADRGRNLVQRIVPAPGDFPVEFPDTTLLFLPVIGELDLAGQCPLGLF